MDAPSWVDGAFLFQQAVVLTRKGDLTIRTLPTTYNPTEVEPRWYAQWLRAGYFHATVDPARTPYVIMLPLPNVTGELHIGSVSTFSPQDALIRWRRMQGYNALWQPGTDHAGIATQNVVERELTKEGITLGELGRERFVERVGQWRAQYGGMIDRQLKRMGYSCDWDRYVFTLDPAYYDAVLEAFIRLYNEGLIYRGKRMVNWCPRDQSAISDLEVEYEEIDSSLWFVRYPGADGSAGVVIATQRPETILADVAVAVHPDDDRYRALVGTEVIVPLTKRHVPIIADRRVDPEFGTGALKITPGHDLLDNEIGQDHGLPVLVILDERGAMTPDAGRFAGLDRFDARARVAEAIAALGLIEKIEPYRTSVGTCDRCHAIIEPYISDQWFCDMTDMAARAAEAIRAGRVRFHHERWAKVVLNFLDHIRPWTLSRQLWWGHRIPVWLCASCGERVAAKITPDRCPGCGGTVLEQDPDVLDTWFSSGLWPFATLGWPQDTPDLRYFYPGSVLATANEILFLWVARMIMLGLHFRDNVPFTDVYVTPTVLTLEGRRMSKSLGTGMDPLEMVDARGYGADALRFALISRCSQSQQDLRFAEKMIADVRNFNTKIWNATRFVLMNLRDFPAQELALAPPTGGLALSDRWIRSRFARVVDEVTTAFEDFELDRAARTLYDFIWGEFCDWYLELAKVDLQVAGDDQRPTTNDQRRLAVQHTLWYVLSNTMKLLHPIMPFLTEEVWHQLPHAGESIMIAAWPSSHPEWIDAAAEADMDALIEVIRSVRSFRTDLAVAPGTLVTAEIRPSTLRAEALKGAHRYIAHLAKAEPTFTEPGTPKPPSSVGAVLASSEVYISAPVRDAGKERRRIQRDLDQLDAELGRLRQRLENEEFVTRAPAEVVVRERARLAEMEGRRKRLTELLAAIR
ncbi:MAG TPA: valine--tRNA ligase [bacterium]